MDSLPKYITSPFVMFQGHDKKIRLIELRQQERYKMLGLEVYEVLWFFLQPATHGEALKKGLSDDAIHLCIEESLIVNISSSTLKALEKWENSNWSRAAYLTFSQFNLPYKDLPEEKLSQIDLVKKRREMMDLYKRQGKYPKRHVPESKKVIKINPTTQDGIDFNSVRDRRSVRSFSKEKISFRDFSDIFYEATREVRTVKQSQEGDDSFFILNSFYSWLIIYVYIQGVKGIDKGLYCFDVESSKLLFIHNKVTNQTISECIQGQTWIGGGGFCLLIGSHWERYAWIYRHSRAYINLLIQLGEISEEFILASYKKDLGGWMTPAVTESKINSLCSLENTGVDILYFMKFGMKG